MAWKSDSRMGSGRCLLPTSNRPRRSVQMRTGIREERGKRSFPSSISHQKAQLPLQPVPQKRNRCHQEHKIRSKYQAKCITIHSHLPLVHDRCFYPIQLWIFSFPALTGSLSMFSMNLLYARNTGEDSSHGLCQWLSTPFP